MNTLPKVRLLMNEYQSSLKVIRAEEFFDLVLFRPLAFLFVKGIARTGVTPNQITFVSVIVFLAAAWMIASGSAELVLWAGILIAAGNVLDCADGQLARVKGNGTQYGRILDGIGDYVSAIAFLVAIGYWGIANLYEPLFWWPITVATMLAYGWQSALVDFHRNEFVARMNGARSFLEMEMKETRKELIELKHRFGKMFEKFALSMYLCYLTIQSKIQPREQSDIDSHTYVMANSNIIRFWCLNGSATSRFLIVVACLMNHVEFFVAYVLILGTLWSLSLQAFQMAIDKKLEVREPL